MNIKKNPNTLQVTFLTAKKKPKYVFVPIFHQNVLTDLDAVFCSNLKADCMRFQSYASCFRIGLRIFVICEYF